MRTIQDIQNELVNAIGLRDAERAIAFAQELEEHNTPPATALALQTRADVLRWTSRHDEAVVMYDQALRMFAELGDLNGTANVTNNKANLLWSIGDHKGAVALWQEALGIHKQRQDSANVARVTLNLGAAYGVFGDLKASLHHYFEGLALAESVGNLILQSTAFGNIGIAYKLSGDYAQAINYFTRALEIHTTLGNKTGLATTALNFGTVYKALGEYQRALEYIRSAREQYEAIGDRSLAAMTVQHIGAVLQELGDIEGAIAEFDRSFAVYEEIGEPVGMAHVATQKAMLLVDIGAIDEAQEVIDRVVSLGVADMSVDIEIRIQRAKCKMHYGELEEAHNALRDALTLSTTSGLKDESVRIHQILRDLAYSRRNIDDYVEHNKAYLSLHEELKGAEASRRIAMSDAQRLIDAERVEKERHQNLVHTMLPRSIAERVIRGETINDAVEFAAVLFIDMVNFTQHSYSLNSEQLVSLLDRVFTEFDRIMARHDLIKIKTIGDSYMAVAIDGAPTELLERTLRAAVEAINTNFIWPDTQPPSRVSFRAGLHCGPLTAGVVGTDRLQYDVWGDTVNVASRMESTGEAGRIQVSDAVAALLPAGTWHLESRGMIEIKGRGAMTTYWVFD